MRQEIFKGNPKSVIFSVDQNVEPSIAYYRMSPDEPLSGLPVTRGIYLAIISYNGDAHHMGASKRVEMVIR